MGSLGLRFGPMAWKRKAQSPRWGLSVPRGPGLRLGLELLPRRPGLAHQAFQELLRVREGPQDRQDREVPEDREASQSSKGAQKCYRRWREPPPRAQERGRLSTSLCVRDRAATDRRSCCGGTTSRPAARLARLSRGNELSDSAARVARHRRSPIAGAEDLSNNSTYLSYMDLHAHSPEYSSTSVSIPRRRLGPQLLAEVD